jgi:abortive infection bacteriophage resistance protein
MKYTKPPLTFDQQADLLLSRGLMAEKTELILKLKSVSYYRLSGYLFPFRNSDDSKSHWQKRLEDLLDRYPDVQRKPMGFAENWKECPIWRENA